MKFKHVHLLIIGVAIFFASCSKYPKNALVISKDASVVAVFDIKSLATKAEFSKIKETALYKKMSKELKSEDKTLFNQVEELMGDPSKSGIDLSEALFVFKVKLSDNRDYVGASLAVSSASKINEFFNTLPSKIKSDMKITVDGKNNYIYEKNSSFVAMWNDDKMLLLSAISASADLLADAKVFIAQEKEKSIVTNKKFEAFYENKKDISIWASANVATEIPIYGALLKESMADYKDSYFQAYLSFEQSEVIWKFELDPSEKLKKKMEAANIWKKSIASNTLQVIPGKSIAFIGAAYDTKKYYEFIKDQKQIKEAEAQIQAIIGYSLKEVLTAFGGDFVLSFNGIEKKMTKQLEMKFDTITYEYTSDSVMKEQTTYDFTTALSVTNEKLITNILTKYQLIDSAVANGPNPPKYYKFPMVLELYYGFAKGNFLLTTNKNVIENACNGKSIGDDISSDEQGAELTKRFFYAYANLNVDKYPKALKQSIETNKQAVKVFKILESVTMSSEGLYNATLTLKLKNVKSNSLNTIFTSIDDYYQSLLSAK